MKDTRKTIRRKDLVSLLGILVLIVLLLFIGSRLIERWQIRRQQVEPPPRVVAAADDGQLTYQGRHYAEKENIRSYLFLGIDRDEPAKGVSGYHGGGQSDVLFLLVVDDSAQTWQLLHINRDNIVEVPILGITGRPVNYEYQQIALAHAYGDGTENSCRNTVSAVSTMLGGREIDGYFALNMGGIPILNDFVGGVNVTVESDFSDIDASLVKGQTVTLSGQQAYNFIRYRKNVDDETNLARMERHRVYITGLMEKLGSLSDEELLQAYDAAFDYTVTDIGSKTFVELGKTVQSYSQLDTLTIEGQSFLDEEGCNAVALDEDSLNRAVLALFFTPVQ